MRQIETYRVKGAGQEPAPTRSWAILHLRCPRCRRGIIFRTLLGMNNLCPTCGLKFEREPGYFIGSMYISYGFAAVLIGLFALLIGRIFFDLAFQWVVLIAAAMILPLVPVIVRYSRVIWMHIDRAIDPER